MNTCPCCSTQLLRHARHNTVYWFCSHCWQEMPDLSETILSRQRGKRIESLIEFSSWTPKVRSLDEVGIA